MIPHDRPDPLQTFPSIIDAVKTPLGFFSLIVLIVAVIVLVAARAFPVQQNWLLIVAVIWISAALLIVPFFAWTKPEALYGKRPWHALFARQLADDVYVSLEGSMSNLLPGEQVESWTVLADYVDNTEDADQRVFTHEFAERIRYRADLGARRFKRGGRVQ
jgi:uncharacterized SAM-binding protein YcdF (DUF218 family)